MPSSPIAGDREIEAAGASRPGWDHLLGHAALLAAYVRYISSIHRDPTTGLPDRQAFHSLLKVAIGDARSKGRDLALLWVNPDDFGRLNQLFGSKAGDCAVREIAERLRRLLRAHDLVARYGGVTLAVILRGTTADGARRVAGRILQELSEASYLEGATRLKFSIGVAMFDAEDGRLGHPLELERRADQALSAAKRMGGATMVAWEENTGGEHGESFDRMSGIFTGDVAKDYRNMMVLWDTVNVVAGHDTLDRLAAQAIDKLFDGLKPQGIGLFAPSPEGDLVLLRGLTRQYREEGSPDRQETLEVDGERMAWIQQAMEEGSTREALLPRGDLQSEPSTRAARCYAVPLISGKEPLGALYIEWTGDEVQLDSSDLLFLNGLGLQLTLAWDRVRLVERDLRNSELEKRQLRAELRQLRRAVHHTKLVYRSPEMEEIMSTARRVARFDATVLVTGPSGTGKELVARTIHELSERRDRPFVIVDCSSIPTTLIESELFGSERGAYTGAQERRLGRLVEADKGTVLLDEIGELPLEVQSKLLRFVQDKQFTTVGGSGSRTVDVRILAATNRDLLAEAVAGRFREDLFYRLNVVQIAIPALKDRPSDIIHLAQYFLERYSVQYQKDIRGFSRDAGERLLQYPWPGNVRELQNCMMRAILLCEGPILTPGELGLSTAEAGQVTPGAATGGPTPHVDQDFEPESDEEERPGVAENLLGQLAADLGRQIAVAATDATDPVPIGQWLRDELLLAANRATAGVRERGAVILDLPSSTYRRRLDKALERREAESPPRSSEWERVRDSIQRLVELASSIGGLDSLSACCERVLLTEIIARYPGQTRVGSALLGVTPPTFRSRAAALQ